MVFFMVVNVSLGLSIIGIFFSLAAVITLMSGWINPVKIKQDISSFSAAKIKSERSPPVTQANFLTCLRYLIAAWVFIAPIIIVYEMAVLILFDGKLKGRDIPWKLYYHGLKVRIKDKIKER